MLQDIASLYGPYWTRRAEMQVARFAGSVKSEDIAMLTRAAQLAVQDDRPDDAIAFYDRARAAALAKGDPVQAFESGYAAAAIEHRRKRFDQALRRFRDVAVAMPDNPLAPEAHLLAAWHAGRLFEQAPKGDTASHTAFSDILAEHLRHWPDAPTANRVRYQLGVLYQQSDRPAEALDVYQRISSDFAAYPDVLEAIGRCVAVLSQRTPSDAPRLSEEAAKWFKRLVVGPDGQLPQRWSPTRSRRGAGGGTLFTWKHHVAPRKRKSSFEPPWPILKARRPSGGLKRRTLPRRGTDGGGQARNKPLRLPKPKCKTPIRLTVRPSRETQAELLAKTPAIAPRRWRPFETLVEKHPKEAAIRRRFAELLSEGDDRASLEKSLTQWRALAEGLRPDTQEWFEAKYRTAEMHVRLG